MAHMLVSLTLSCSEFVRILAHMVARIQKNVFLTRKSPLITLRVGDIK